MALGDRPIKLSRLGRASGLNPDNDSIGGDITSLKAVYHTVVDHNPDHGPISNLNNKMSQYHGEFAQMSDMSHLSASYGGTLDPTHPTPGLTTMTLTLNPGQSEVEHHWFFAFQNTGSKFTSTIAKNPNNFYTRFGPSGNGWTEDLHWFSISGSSKPAYKCTTLSAYPSTNQSGTLTAFYMDKYLTENMNQPYMMGTNDTSNTGGMVSQSIEVNVVQNPAP